MVANYMDIPDYEIDIIYTKEPRINQKFWENFFDGIQGSLTLGLIEKYKSKKEERCSIAFKEDNKSIVYLVTFSGASNTNTGQISRKRIRRLKKTLEEKAGAPLIYIYSSSTRLGYRTPIVSSEDLSILDLETTNETRPLLSVTLYRGFLEEIICQRKYPPAFNKIKNTPLLIKIRNRNFISRIEKMTKDEIKKEGRTGEILMSEIIAEKLEETEKYNTCVLTPDNEGRITLPQNFEKFAFKE